MGTYAMPAVADDVLLAFACVAGTVAPSLHSHFRTADYVTDFDRVRCLAVDVHALVVMHY